MFSRPITRTRLVWIVIGFLVAVVAAPTAAVAIALKFTGIQGATSGNKAEVSKDNQLLVAEANPSTYYNSGFVSVASLQVIANSVPGGDALVVKSITLNAYSAIGTDPYIGVHVTSAANCSGPDLFVEAVDVASGVNSTVTLPFIPGLVIPSGGSLCASGSGASADGHVSGYLVPAARLSKPAMGPVAATQNHKHG